MNGAIWPSAGTGTNAAADRLLGKRDGGSWPDPRTFVDANWDEGERHHVADYLRWGVVARVFMGKSTCRFCQEQVGHLEVTDGEWIWPDGLAHYVSQHRVRLPDRFVGHVAEMGGQFEDAPVGPTWWRDQGGN